MIYIRLEYNELSYSHITSTVYRFKDKTALYTVCRQNCRKRWLHFAIARLTLTLLWFAHRVFTLPLLQITYLSQQCYYGTVNTLFENAMFTFFYL